MYKYLGIVCNTYWLKWEPAFKKNAWLRWHALRHVCEALENKCLDFCPRCHQPFALEIGSSHKPSPPPRTLPQSIFICWEHDEDGWENTYGAAIGTLVGMGKVIESLYAQASDLSFFPFFLFSSVWFSNKFSDFLFTACLPASRLFVLHKSHPCLTIFCTPLSYLIIILNKLWDLAV